MNRSRVGLGVQEDSQSSSLRSVDNSSRLPREVAHQRSSAKSQLRVRSSTSNTRSNYRETTISSSLCSKRWDSPIPWLSFPLARAATRIYCLWAILPCAPCTPKRVTFCSIPDRRIGTTSSLVPCRFPPHPGGLPATFSRLQRTQISQALQEMGRLSTWRTQ